MKWSAANPLCPKATRAQAKRHHISRRRLTACCWNCPSNRHQKSHWRNTFSFHKKLHIFPPGFLRRNWTVAITVSFRRNLPSTQLSPTVPKNICNGESGQYVEPMDCRSLILPSQLVSGCGMSLPGMASNSMTSSGRTNGLAPVWHWLSARLKNEWRTAWCLPFRIFDFFEVRNVWTRKKNHGSRKCCGRTLWLGDGVPTSYNVAQVAPPDCPPILHGSNYLKTFYGGCFAQGWLGTGTKRT